MTQPQKAEPPQPLPTSPDDLFKKLDDLGISYTLHHHEPIFTVAEGEHLKKEIPGTHCRNLFLRDKKNNTVLLVAANETQLDLKKLPDLVGMTRISFGSAERLWEMLGIRPGSVNPFTVINDTNRRVRVVLDAAMMKAGTVNYHPMDNAMTVSITPDDLVKFLAFTGHAYKIVDLSPAAPA